MNETGVSVCTGLHLGRAMEGEQSFSICLAYSGINTSEIEQGLGKLEAFIKGWNIPRQSGGSS